MRLLEPFADPLAPLARRNPLAKVAASAVLTVGLLASLDPIVGGIILAVHLVAVPAFGLSLRAVTARAWPLLATCGGTAASYLFFAPPAGSTVASLGPLTISAGVLTDMASLILRLSALTLSTVVVFASTDPTDLADALVQNAKASPRFVIGTLAAMRTVTLLSHDWDMLRLARRARGIEPGRNPLARIRFLASLVFGLLVLAIRRGTALARAMDARGFDAGRPRTAARPQRFGRADAVLVLGALAVAAAAIWLSVSLGAFHPLLR